MNLKDSIECCMRVKVCVVLVKMKIEEGRV